MRWNIFTLVLLPLASSPIAQAWQSQTPEAPVLTLEEGVRQALRNNPEFRVAELETLKAGDQYLAARTYRLPRMTVYGIGGQLLTRPGITIPRGALGVYPGTGPIPGADARVDVPSKLAGFFLAQAAQPLTQLIRINLQLKVLDLQRKVQEARTREQRQKTVAQVTQVYYGISQAQSAYATANAALPLFRETARLAEENAKRETVLPSEAAKARAQLAAAELRVVQARNPMLRAKEQLNLLLGRDVRAEFSVSPLESLDESELDLEESRAAALANRPELLQARLAIKAAEYDRRAKLAEYIPDVSLSFQYMNFVNIGYGLPTNFASAGLLLQWEPWDWGRRRHEADAKRRTERQATLRHESAERQVLLDVDNAVRELDEARAAARVMELQRQAALENVREKQVQYAREAVLLRDLLEAQTQMAVAENDARQAVARFWTARAEVRRARGEE